MKNDALLLAKLDKTHNPESKGNTNFGVSKLHVEVNSCFSAVSAQLYLDGISNAGSIRIIDICGQGLGDRTIIKILNQLQGSTVEVLSFSNNKLTDESLYRMAAVMPSLMSLGSLNLSGNDFGDYGVQAIFNTSIIPVNLKHLDLSRNSLGVLAAYSIGSAFTSSSGNARIDGKVLNIRSLSLGGNLLQGQSLDFIRILMSFFCQMSHQHGLESLNLACTGLETDGLSTVATFIACSGSIADINISNNSFECERCKIFVRSSLRSNKSLRNIRLGKCSLPQADKTLFLEAMASKPSLGWRDKTSLSILAARELSKCDMARHSFEASELNLWNKISPPEWPRSIYLVDEAAPSEMLRLPHNESRIPFFIISSIEHLNEVFSALIYLEDVTARMHHAERGIGGGPLSVGNALSARDIALRNDKLGSLRLLFLDYEDDSLSDGVVDSEHVSILIEDLLSTLIIQETAVAQSISRAYGRQLQRQDTVTNPTEGEGDGGSSNCNTLQRSEDSVARTNLASRQRVEHLVPSYASLGDAALFIHYLYVVRPSEVALIAAVRTVVSQKKLKKSSRGGKKKVLETAMITACNMDADAIQHPHASPVVEQMSSTLDEIETELAKSTPSPTLVRSPFAELDKKMLQRLVASDLGPEEGERAILSNSRTNQKKIIFEFGTIQLPVAGPRTANSVLEFPFPLEEEAPRSRDKMMNLHAIEATGQDLADAEYFRLSFAERHQRRKDFFCN